MAAGGLNHDRLAEAAELELHLIGNILHAPEKLDAVADTITPKHFANADLAWLFGVMLEWHAAGNRLTLPQLVKRYADVIKDMALVNRFVEWTSSALAFASEFDDIAASVRRCGEVRMLQDAFQKLAMREVDDPRILLGEAEAIIGSSAVANEDADFSCSAGESAGRVIARAMQAGGGLTSRVGCHFLPEWNELTRKLDSDWLVTLGGRPAMGKTALALEVARAAAEENIGVAIFSLEMSADQCATRMLASMSMDSQHPVTATQIEEGDLTDGQRKVLRLCKESLDRWPLYIYDRPGLTIARARHWARTYKRLCEVRGTKLGLIVIDFLQLMHLSTVSRGRTEDVTMIAQGLKNLAKELRLPILALSQLSRSVEQRDDKRPSLSDLRESGAIEQSSDVVLFVYRDEYYIGKKKPKPGEEAQLQAQLAAVAGVAEIICAKNRHGSEGRREVAFIKEHQAFRSLGLVRP